MFKKIIIIILILFIVIFYTKLIINEIFKDNKNKENFSNNKLIKIGLIIPSTSSKRNYKNIEDLNLFKILINSMKNKLNKNYEYNFYIGYDHDDQFYNKNKHQIINYFNKLKLQNSNIYLIQIHNKKGNLSAIWSDLAVIASKKCEYLYQIGDDIEIITPNWEDKFINKLKENNNIGVVGATDLNNKNLMTQSFVHKNHLKIFKTYFPKELKNWYVDDWVQNVYKPSLSHLFKNLFLKNSGGVPRYDIYNINTLYKEILNRDKIYLKNYLILPY